MEISSRDKDQLKELFGTLRSQLPTKDIIQRSAPQIGIPEVVLLEDRYITGQFLHRMGFDLQGLGMYGPTKNQLIEAYQENGLAQGRDSVLLLQTRMAETVSNELDKIFGKKIKI